MSFIPRPMELSHLKGDENMVVMRGEAVNYALYDGFLPDLEDIRPNELYFKRN